MNNLRLPLFLLALCLCTSGFSQIKFTVKEIPADGRWGVYAKPCQAIAPSGNTITGSAQITIVLPLGNDVSGLTNHAGLWDENATVSGPDEAPSKNYISFGFLSDSPQIIYSNDEETLLFSFECVGNAGAVPHLIDNDADPFAGFPNSINSNPGNELSVIDIGTSPVGYYYYGGNFSVDSEDDCFGMVDTTIVTPSDTTTGNENPTITLEQLNLKNCFTLAPNPTSTWISVQFLAPYFNSNGKVKLSTSNGINIGTLEKNGQSRMTLNVGALPNGMYFLSYESGGKVIQQERFIKQ